MAFTLRPIAPLDGSSILTDDLIAQYVKPSSAADQDLIAVLRDAAVEWVERHTEVGMTSRSWSIVFDGITRTLALPRAPVTAITAVTYVARGGQESVQTGPWQAGPDGMLATRGWATVPWAASVRVDFVAGYASAANVPSPLRTAALLMLRHLYDGGDADEAPGAIALLCDTIRTPVIG